MAEDYRAMKIFDPQILLRRGQAPRRSAYRDVRSRLLMVFGFVFLAELFVTRSGWKWSKLSWSRGRKQAGVTNQ